MCWGCAGGVKLVCFHSAQAQKSHGWTGVPSQAELQEGDMGVACQAGTPAQWLLRMQATQR